MRITNLNLTHNVFKRGHAKWQATFYSSKAYMEAIVRMHEAFGPGKPYQNCWMGDNGQTWYFRNMDPNILHKQNHAHRIYLTNEKQITFLTMAFESKD